MITIGDLVGARVKPYFKVSYSAGSITITESDFKNMVSSLTVTEKEREATVATLSIYDQIGYFSKIFNYGQILEIEWGLKRTSDTFITFEDEVTGDYFRGAMKFSVLSTNTILRNGLVTLSINLRMNNFDNADRKTRRFTTGTIRSVMTKVCSEIQASLVAEFSDADVVLTPKNQLNQNDETNIAFLHRISAKYNFKLVYQHDAQTKRYKIYAVDWSKEKNYNFPALRGLKGKYHYFDYKTAESNIIDGSFDTNNSAPLGDNAEIRIGTDGKPVMFFRPSPQEEVQVYVLNEAKIKAELKKGTYADQMALLSSILMADQEAFIEKGGLRDQYFRREIRLTAPQGNGWTGSFNVVANPLYQVGDFIIMSSKGNASPIPARFKTVMGALGQPDKKTLWRITDIEHAISPDGYTMKVGCAR